jgi:nitrite reductase/ring-hydroxylating ferredoxin subunit
LQALKNGKMKTFHIFCRLHDVRFYMRDRHLSGTLTKKPIRTWSASIVDGVIMFTVDAL